jgi:DNA-directed RNA polymerase II subunit RPB1
MLCVENSYLWGLTQEFFHAMAGREGLINTAVKTAETGYYPAPTCEALEDVSICYDGTVRNSLGDILRFVYGEEGMDGTYIKQQKIDSYHMSDRAFYDKFCVNVIGAEDENTGFREGVLQVGLDVSTLELQRELDREWEQLFEDRGVKGIHRVFMMERPKTTS